MGSVASEISFIQITATAMAARIPHSDASLSWPAIGLIGLVRLYRATLSPAFALVGRCRHEPSCSDFMCEAVSLHGAWAGGWMGAARLCRCRPGGSWGYDPAPAQKPTDACWWKPWTYGDWRGGFRAPPETNE